MLGDGKGDDTSSSISCSSRDVAIYLRVILILEAYKIHHDWGEIFLIRE